jgi:5-methylthioadenosine/S-adenosylhomocysteine deaminase
VKILIRGGQVLPMDAAGTVLTEGYVLIEDGTIAAVGPLSEAPATSEVNHVEEAHGCLVVPGLINSHQHHWYHLLKGLSVGLYLEDWVREVLHPASEALEPDDILISMRLAAADMLATGTTTFFNHSVVETDLDSVVALAEVSRATGIRQIFGKEIRATPTRTSPQVHWQEVEELLRRFPIRAEELFSVGLAIETGEHWIRQGTMTTELAGRVAELSRRFAVPVSDHITGGTLSRSVTDFRLRTGLGQVEWGAKHGLLHERALLAHAVWMGDDEILLAAEAGASVVTCPSSSAFTAGGIPPIRGWLAAGLNVAIGSDGPMVNDSVDILGLLRECFLLQNVKYLKPAAVPMEQLWCMATRNAARALGLAGKVGELTPGASADVAVFDLRSPQFGGALNPPVNTILSGGNHEARVVIVRGQYVKDASGLLTVNVAEVVEEARQSALNLARRAGLPVRC